MSSDLPKGFVDLNDLIDDLQVDLKYFTGDNFIGAQVRGYERSRCIITQAAAQALVRVQQTLSEFGLGLKIFDAYRPQMAVDHFIQWCGEITAPVTQSRFFPDLQPAELFSKGYLIKHSSHSRGSTVDLTLIDSVSGEELDMGTEFDFFGPLSWFDATKVSAQARANRMLLQQTMVQHGFVPFHQEWWHFTLADEPFPSRYFDFPIG